MKRSEDIRGGPTEDVVGIRRWDRHWPFDWRSKGLPGYPSMYRGLPMPESGIPYREATDHWAFDDDMKWWEPFTPIEIPLVKMGTDLQRGSGTLTCYNPLQHRSVNELPDEFMFLRPRIGELETACMFGPFRFHFKVTVGGRTYQQAFWSESPRGAVTTSLHAFNRCTAGSPQRGSAGFCAGISLDAIPEEDPSDKRRAWLARYWDYPTCDFENARYRYLEMESLLIRLELSTTSALPFPVWNHI